jgi:putative transposase
VAGLVRRGSEWPGLWSDPALIGGEGVVLERPEGFFRADGPLPATARLRFHPPPGFTSTPELVAELERRLAHDEDRAAAGLAARGRSFMGVALVLAQKPNARPANGEPHRGLSPRVATRTKWKRREALLQLAGFRAAYDDALAAWRAGVRDVTFPLGTWLMRVQHRACCAAPAC